MYFRRKTWAGRAYLQIVESRRDGDQVRQQVISQTLGRFEELQASGQLERLVRLGARFAVKAMVLSAAGDEAATTIADRRIGTALRVRAAVARDRLWRGDYGADGETQSTALPWNARSSLRCCTGCS